MQKIHPHTINNNPKDAFATNPKKQYKTNNRTVNIEDTLPKWLCMYACMCVYGCMHACIWLYVCLCAYVYGCMCVYVYGCMHVYGWNLEFVCMHAWI